MVLIKLGSTMRSIIKFVCRDLCIEGKGNAGQEKWNLRRHYAIL